MDSLIFELQIVFYFQLFLSANVRHRFQASSGNLDNANWPGYETERRVWELKEEGVVKAFTA